ncbi:hypothetical protein LEP48_01060 [Isoptericola sp. NEAU-Y5]|uniref:FtsX-like permease family protein n=1 Tax=Isoptericola luteus TaxID=2879484 RepID=A0ABS7ZEA3_9MICO|nr:FtsX-like permease family protein [Isoptericola sp. NEAU-Y5]MCA5891939.1 hypothetical protein [Isoptericola sp. NEAU-Y5]
MAAGTFDACWVETWPESEHVAPLLTLPVAGGSDVEGEQLVPMVRQLNPTAGTSFDAADRLANLPTLPLTAAAVVLAVATGLVLVRARRLELASALHAGIDKASLLVQLAVETLVWTVTACALVLPVVWWAAAAGNPDPAWSAFYPALRTTGLAVVGVLVATLVVGALTQEKHLFRYFKHR